MFQIIASGTGPGHHHDLVKQAFIDLVHELRKIDPDVQVRFLSIDGTEPSFVVHPRSLLEEGHPDRLMNEDGSPSFTGENPQIISGNESEVK